DEAISNIRLLLNNPFSDQKHNEETRENRNCQSLTLDHVKNYLAVYKVRTDRYAMDITHFTKGELVILAILGKSANSGFSTVVAAEISAELFPNILFWVASNTEEFVMLVFDGVVSGSCVGTAQTASPSQNQNRHIHRTHHGSHISHTEHTSANRSQRMAVLTICT